MHMWFWFSSKLGTFLFYGYEVNTVWAFVATCFGLFSLAIAYEAMKVLQMKLHNNTLASMNSGSSVNSENSSLLTQTTTDGAGTAGQNWKKWARWILEVVHWIMHTTLGYILMLAVMSFNAYIGIVLVLGASVGYWIFGMTLIDMNLAQLRKVENKTAPCDPECADGVENASRQVSSVSSIEDQIVTEVSAELHPPSADH